MGTRHGRSIRRSSHAPDSSSITVNESEGSGYELVNIDGDESVHANYIGDE
jgi:hypothetical protein